jgi:hypothetical protein
MYRAGAWSFLLRYKVATATSGAVEAKPGIDAARMSARTLDLSAFLLCILGMLVLGLMVSKSAAVPDLMIA